MNSTSTTELALLSFCRHCLVFFVAGCCCCCRRCTTSSNSCRCLVGVTATILAVKLLIANRTAPTALWRYSQRRPQTVHVISSVTIVAEQQLIIVVRCAANRTIFALYALPPIATHRNNHVWGELQARRMSGTAAIRARHQILRYVGFAIFARIS